MLPRPCEAGPNAGAVLVVHANPSLVYSAGTGSYCGQSGLAACGDAVTSAPWLTGTATVLHVLAAFPGSASPRLKALSFGVAWDSTRLQIAAQGGCGDFDVPSDGWPAPGSGVGQSWTEAQTSHLAEAWWFAAYTYAMGGGSDTTSFAVVPHPRHGGVLVDDSMPPVEDALVAYGRFGFGTTGWLPCPGGLDGGGSAENEGEGGGLEGGLDLPPEDPGLDGGEPGGPVAALGLSFVELGTNSDSAFVEESRALRREYGLDILVGNAPDGLFCQLDEGQKSLLRADPRVLLVTDEEIENPDGTARLGEPGFSERVWNAMLEIPPPDTLPPASEWLDVVEERHQPQPSSTRQTSTYMLGEVGVSLVFAESRDSRPCDPGNGVFTENWCEDDPREIIDLQGEINAALGQLASQAPDASLQFQCFPRLYTVEAEPIQGRCSESSWKVELLDSLGVEPGAYDEMCFAWNNQRRQEWKTDWWFTLFIARSECDPDGAFPEGSYGCAAMLGPGATVCSRPGSRTVGYTSAHETCHVFGAPDESTSWPCPQEYGYLQWPNLNARSSTGCAEHVACLMDGRDYEWDLCVNSRRHLGWWDRDYDDIYDPLDHPFSGTSMLVGEEEPLAEGDSVNIFTTGEQWVKRLDASVRAMDQGCVLWDGIDYRGDECAPGEYLWKRNDGTLRVDSLRSDTQPPASLDLTVERCAPPPNVKDILHFRFTDGDTRAGRVRATAVPYFGSPKRVVEDELYLQSASGDPANASACFHMDAGCGSAFLSVLVWDVGAGHSVSGSVPFVPTSDVIEGTRALVPGLRLSPGRPNPSRRWVSWELQPPAAVRLDLTVVGADGRLVRFWPGREVAAGPTRILWDGCDDRGRGVPSGKYWLVATDPSGQVASRSVTILR